MGKNKDSCNKSTLKYPAFVDHHQRAAFAAAGIQEASMVERNSNNALWFVNRIRTPLTEAAMPTKIDSRIFEQVYVIWVVSALQEDYCIEVQDFTFFDQRNILLCSIDYFLIFKS